MVKENKVTKLRKNVRSTFYYTDNNPRGSTCQVFKFCHGKFEHTVKQFEILLSHNKTYFFSSKNCTTNVRGIEHITVACLSNL